MSLIAAWVVWASAVVAWGCCYVMYRLARKERRRLEAARAVRATAAPRCTCDPQRPMHETRWYAHHPGCPVRELHLATLT